MLIINLHIRYEDGSSTDYLNVEPNRVPELLARIDWKDVREYRVARAELPVGSGA